MNPGKKYPPLSLHQTPQRTIWAVGGGKGGTGKSFIAANLAIHLAAQEKDVVLIDADLGGPNLHTFLGMNDSNLDVGYFFTNKVSELKDTVALTPFDGLKLIKGTDKIPFMANLNYYKKLKFIRHIKAFDARRVIIDIGTGTAYNCIDFFILSNPGILVINPEPTSIENAYYFLKSCILRILKSHIEYYKIQDLIRSISHKIEDQSRSIYSFFNAIISHDKTYAQILYKALQRFHPCLIVNKAREERDFMLGESMADVIQKYLVVDVKLLGTVPFDERVHASLRNLTSFIRTYPQSEAAASIREIAGKLTEPHDRMRIQQQG
ncbi:MAG: MinD/ParA family protein [Candidatus Aminicenantes bacterium]